jgi:hypothetical protein
MVLYVVLGAAVMAAGVVLVSQVYQAGYRSGYKDGVQARKDAAEATKANGGQ